MDHGWDGKTVSSYVSAFLKVNTCFLIVYSVSVSADSARTPPPQTVVNTYTFKMVDAAPFASRVSPGFWHGLQRRKLNLYRLSTEPVPLLGSFSSTAAIDVQGVPEPGVLAVDEGSFSAYEAGTDGNGESALARVTVAAATSAADTGSTAATAAAAAAASATPSSSPAPCRTGAAAMSSSVAVRGSLHVVNTAEDFKRFDKKKLLRDEAEHVLRAMCFGDAVNDPSLLNRFSVLSFPNLKSYKFLYWFCFASLLPATPEVLVRPAATLAVARETWGDDLPETFRDANYDAIKAVMFPEKSDAVAGAEAAAAGPPLLLPQQIAVVLLGSEALTLAEFEARAAELGPDRCAAEVRAGRFALALVDPCTLPSQPGWTARNLISMAERRWAPLWSAVANSSSSSSSSSSGGGGDGSSATCFVRLPLLCVRIGARGEDKGTVGPLSFAGSSLALLLDIPWDAGASARSTEATDAFPLAPGFLPAVARATAGEKDFGAAEALVTSLASSGQARFVGWERHRTGRYRGKLLPRRVDLSKQMRPESLAAASVDLNVRLMKWRQLPSLDTAAIRECRCLLLGAGTLVGVVVGRVWVLGLGARSRSRLGIVLSTDAPRVECSWRVECER